MTILNTKQKDAYDCMMRGENVFITGSGGVGKSTVIDKFVCDLQISTNCLAVTSTTGISALLIKGVTLHSYLGIGLGEDSVEGLYKRVKKFKSYERWRNLKVLIIDEISMLSPELFTKLESLARRIRRNNLCFGGIQLILSGDFCQLPPVKSDKLCFESECWSECVKNTFYLTEIVRQSDSDFKKCLNSVRIGDISEEVKSILSTRVGAELVNSSGIKPTRLYSTNNMVNSINTEELYKIAKKNKSCIRQYDMDFEFVGVNNKKQYSEKYKRNCMASETLELCIGAQVMLLHNLHIDIGLANGSRGVVIDFTPDDVPIVKFLNGVVKEINDHEWEYKEKKKKITIYQYPLKLAWALTIHKSQGSTIDYAEIDLSNPFERGMAYVALSRVKSLDGLTIVDIDYSKIKANQKAVRYYNSL